MKSLLAFALLTFSFVGTAIPSAQKMKDASPWAHRTRTLEKLRLTEVQTKD